MNRILGVLLAAVLAVSVAPSSTASAAPIRAEDSVGAAEEEGGTGTETSGSNPEAEDDAPAEVELEGDAEDIPADTDSLPTETGETAELDAAEEEALFEQKVEAALRLTDVVPWAAASATSLSSGFKAGYIISDNNFYDGDAMNAAQIQTFLNQQLSRCTIGDPGRAPGSAIYGTTVASSCLKDARFSSTTRAANAYCSTYQGGANESAATIIAKVSRACNISPRVLLVMLEKEQSLVTDSWPTVRQFSVAMGYACPDSGPNGSANCDPTQTGFFQQVYRAAWQLQVYKAHPNNYNYKPFTTNTIQWHPNAACGTSRVYIENWATAALYIYTPYRPNQAALDAGWGTGNDCSTYGNRNFYQLYKAWFGSPNTFFPDVPQSHKFYTEIEWMGESGLSTGVQQADGRGTLYVPQGGVTREAMAAFLYRLKGSPSFTAPSTSPFADLSPGDQFYKEITWMHAMGYTTGVKQASGKPKYQPKSNISREAMAAFMYRYEGSPAFSAPSNSPFADMTPGDKFYREVTWMRSEGITTGIKQSSGKPKYAPKDRVSREAMAAFIYRLEH